MIVQSTGVAVGRRGGESFAKALEAAMIAAVEQATADGITDPVQVRKLVIAARDKAIG